MPENITYTYKSDDYSEYLPEFSDKIESVIQNFEKSSFLENFFNFNYFLWSENPEEITNRLGWLYIPFVMKHAVARIDALSKELRKDGFKHVVLLGMGGSSLSGDVFKDVFGVKAGFPDLTIVDTTDPDYLCELKDNIDLNKSVFIVSTKSGGTVETLSAMKFFYNQLGENAGRHFIGITDPGSKLLGIANDFKFRKVFVNDPNIGGRFSVLSYFGLVPAAIIGVDIQKLLDSACSECLRLKEEITHFYEKPSLRLGVVLGTLAKYGKDKLTFLFSEDYYSFGYWVEQLVAESTGKNGVGILPVLDQKNFSDNYLHDDRVFVFFIKPDDVKLECKLEALARNGFPVLKIVVDDVYEIGREFFRFEFATAVAGIILKINPFDQPDVESAKIMARQYLDELGSIDKSAKQNFNFVDNDLKVLSNLDLSSLHDFLPYLEKLAHSYVSIHSYVNPNIENSSQLMKLRDLIEEKSKLPVTLGFGPRFLHSTGQLHKGDGGRGLFIQLVSENQKNLAIPDNPGSGESQLSFAELKLSQAAGDYKALVSKGRSLISIHFSSDVSGEIEKIARYFEK